MATTYREGQPPVEHDGETPPADAGAAASKSAPAAPVAPDVPTPIPATRAPKASPAVKAAETQRRARVSGKHAGKTRR